MTVFRRIGRRIQTVVVGAGAAVVAVSVVFLAVPLSLIAGLVTTLSGERRRHDEAWTGMGDRNTDGLTAFQALCERRLVKAFAATGPNLVDRKISAITFRGKPGDEL